MEYIISVITFVTIFFIIIEITFSLSIFLTISNLKKSIEGIIEHISDLNFKKSTGKDSNVSNLDFIAKDRYKYLPDILKNNLPYTFKTKLVDYIAEESISSREKSALISSKIIDDELWFMSFKYKDLLAITRFLRGLYIPIGSLCALFIFITGYSQLEIGLNAPSFETISKNIFILSFTIKSAGMILAIGIFAFIISNIFNFYITQKSISNELTEAIFQLKASPIKIDKD